MPKMFALELSRKIVGIFRIRRPLTGFLYVVHILNISNIVCYDYIFSNGNVRH